MPDSTEAQVCATCVACGNIVSGPADAPIQVRTECDSCAALSQSDIDRAIELEDFRSESWED